MAALGVVACKVYHYITSNGFRDPIIVDSGVFVNGISSDRLNRLYRQEVEP